MPPSKPTTRYSISAAHRISGKSRTTIQRHIKSGKLSTVEEGEGNRLIDASELIRVYGDDCDFSKEEGTTGTEEGSSPAVQHELHTLHQQVETLAEERQRERDQLQAQIDHLKEALERSQEGHNRATLLLEDRSGGGEWRQALAELETRFQKEQTETIERTRQKIREEVKSRPWWHLLGRS